MKKFAIIILLFCSAVAFGAMRQFGIFSPTLGLREDYPSIFLKKTLHPDQQNIQIKYGEVRRTLGRAGEFKDGDGDKVQAPQYIYDIDAVNTTNETFTHNTDDLTSIISAGDTFRVMGSTGNDDLWTVDSVAFGANTVITVTGDVTDATADGDLYIDTNPILHYHRHITNADSQKILVFTKDHIFEWIDSTDQLTVRFTSAVADSTYWESIDFNNQVVMTDGINKIQKWASGDAATADLDSVGNGLDLDGGVTYCTRAKWLASYENYIIVGNTTEGGTAYPQRIRWCDLSDETTWDSGDAGHVDVAGSDFVAGFGAYKTYLIIFKEASIHRMWNVSSSDIFNLAPLTKARNLGTIAHASIINDQHGNLYYFANDYTIRDIALRELSSAVGRTLKTVNPTTTYIEGIEAFYIDEYGEVWWAIPTGASTTNDTILKYSPDTGAWTKDNFPVRAFGSYELSSTTYTWDTLPFDTWDEWDWDIWDIRDTQAGFVMDLGSDYSGNTYKLHSSEIDDDGTTFTGYFVLTTDFAEKAAIPYYKRWLNTRIYVRSETAGTLEVQAKRDGEANWQDVGSISLVGTGDFIVADLPCDVRARSFDIRFSADNHFEFLGVVFRFIPDGIR